MILIKCCSELKKNNTCLSCIISTWLTFGTKITKLSIHRTSRKVITETRVDINKEYLIKEKHNGILRVCFTPPAVK
ncbi:hypothetical protein HZS_7687 [Henneguya salminicola]|nr:hypothetical protein HZS_7687 [Henneguya salminicola]